MLSNLFSVLLVFASFYLAVLYESTAACALFSFLAICFSAGILQLFSLSGKLCFRMPEVIPDGPNKECLRFFITAENTGFLPLSCARAKIALFDINSQKLYADSLTFSLPPKKQVILPVELSSKYCGKFQVRIEYIRIFSFCSLLNRKLHPALTSTVLFYPDFSLLPVTVSETTRFFAAEHDEFDEVISGTPQIPINQIRTFRPGDRVRQIHWKLSARTDELLVRDAGQPDGFPVLLFLELTGPDKSDSAAWYSSFLEYAASLSFSLLEAKCSHFVIWYDSKEQSVVRYPVRQAEELYTCIYYLLHECPSAPENTLYDLYTRKYPSDTYRTKLLLTASLQLYNDQTLLQTCSKINWYQEALMHSLLV